MHTYLTVLDLLVRLLVPVHMEGHLILLIFLSSAVIRLQELFKLPFNLTYTMTVRQLADTRGDYRRILRMAKDRKETNLVIDCDPQEAAEILKQVRKTKSESSASEF